MSKEDMIKEAVEEAKAEAAKMEDEAAADEQDEAAETKGSVEEEASKETEESQDTKDTESKEKKKFFAKKEKKDKKDEKIEESQMYEIGAKDIIEKILPVIDNFERGLAAVPEESKEDPFVEGMEKIYKQIMTTLEGVGVKPIEAVGQEFNPDFHNAVMHVEDEEAGENIITEEFQKGYMYHDSVVRHSMVKVAN